VPQPLLDALINFGFGGIVCGILLFIIYKVANKLIDKSDALVYKQMAQQEAILKQHAVERMTYATMWENMSSSLNNHSAASQSFHESVCQAHNYQREEHAKIMEGLMKVNAGLDQTEKALGRINGYVNK
jgi:hypothetical protein